MKSIGKLSSVPLSRYQVLQNRLRKNRRELLVFLDHLPVLTAGINYNTENLLVSESFLKESGIELAYLKRGGDWTAHEPGQLVIYPHIDLKKRGLKIAQYMELLLTCIEESVKEVWNLDLQQNKQKPGLYLQSHPEKKLVSIGINFKSFFTSYGIAINIKNDLSVFRLIHPCGDRAENITSLHLLGKDTALEAEFINDFYARFSRRLEWV